MNTDMRLTSAYEWINSKKSKILSVDIFDTLLWRKVPKPIDVFLLLGEKLKKEGWLINAVNAEVFCDARRLAEQTVRKKKAESMGTLSAELTLQEIYWQCYGIFKKITIEEMVQGCIGIINESDVDDLVAMEVALEKQLTLIDENIVNLISYAVSKGKKVALVSDTYFDHSQIKRLLENKKIDVSPFIDAFFLSCEKGVGKRHGLFSHLLNHYQADSNCVLHVGDTYESDIAPALKEGMHTVYYQKHNSHLQYILEKEWSLSELRAHAPLKQLDPKEGDFGLTGLRSKISYHTAQKDLNPTDAFFWKYGATILGPMLTGFVHWVYRRCCEMKQTEILCLMREGRIYADLIRQCASCYPDQTITAKDLWVAKQYMIRSCIFHATYDELSLVYRTHPVAEFTVKDFCQSLGVELQQVPAYAKYANVKLDNKKLLNDLLQELGGKSATRDCIVEHSAERRKRFLTYLRTVVDLPALREIVVLDVGWAATIQGAMQMILSMAGYPISVHGLYLVTYDSTLYTMLQGFIKEGYLLKAGSPYEMMRACAKGNSILEQSSLPDLGPLKGFDDAGHPILGKLDMPEHQKRQIKHIQEGVRQFCEILNNQLKSGNILWDPHSEALAEQLRQILFRSVSCPTKQEAEHFREWKHDYRSGMPHAYGIGKHGYYEHHIAEMFPKAILLDRRIGWPSLYAARVSKYFADDVQSVLKEELSPDCFLSKGYLPLRIYLDCGKGYSKKANRLVQMHSNAERSFYAFEQFFSAQNPIRSIKLVLQCPSSLIRVKSLYMSVGYCESPDPLELSFFEKGHETNQETKRMQQNMAVKATKQLEDSLFFCRKEPFNLIYEFDRQDVCAVKLNLCLEYFPVSCDF